jgi:hypothetical protein
VQICGAGVKKKSSSPRDRPSPLPGCCWGDLGLVAGGVSGLSGRVSNAVHYMKVKLNLPNHVIASQMGWSEAAVDKMVATYAHAEIGALEAIDAAFATLPDATQTQTFTEPLV